MVDVQLERKLKQIISLAKLKEIKAKAEKDHPIHTMQLLTRGRLSVQPVASEAWHYIVEQLMEMQDTEFILNL